MRSFSQSGQAKPATGRCKGRLTVSESGFEGLADSARESADRDLHASITETLDALPTGESPKVCQDCNKRIEKARRELLPGTSHCAACAQKRA